MSETPRPYSRPVFEKSIELRTETAQRVMEREFGRVENALYSLEVILRIIGKPEAVDVIESSVNQLLLECMKSLGEQQERFKKLMDDHGVAEMPAYTQPGVFQIKVASPQIAQFLILVQKLDDLMAQLDALWLLGVVTNQQRADGTYHWQQVVLHLGRRIAELQRRGGKSIARDKETEPSHEVAE